MDRQLIDIAGMDAREQRLGEIRPPLRCPKRRRMKLPIDSSARRRLSGGAISRPSAALAVPRKQRRLHERPDPCRQAEERRFRQRDQPPIAEHVGRARRQRRDQSVAQAQLGAQLDGRGLLHQQRIRPAVDDEAVASLGDDHAPGAIARSRTTGVMPR